MSQQQLDQIVETLSQLTVLDLSNLKKMLEEKWGVQAAAAAVAMPMAAAGGASAAPAAEESTEFNVYLKEAPADKKIGIIKAVREVTGLGLGEAKAFVESGDAGKPVKEKIKKAEAEEIKKKMEEAGAKVEVKGV